MDFWYWVQLILHIISISLAVIMFLVYVAIQFFQKIPTYTLNFKLFDYISFGVVSLLFALGINSGLGFLAFLPLLLLNILAKKLITKDKISGSGRWMEVKWNKFSPKGFNNLPKQMWEQVSGELQRLPQDTHFILPRFITLWIMKYFLKRMRKDSSGVNMPAQLKGREKEPLQQIEVMIADIVALNKLKTKSLKLPFGVLHVTRL